MNRICIIPARGGSKRIPRKNIKLFLGKPIIGYSIKAAIDSKLFDEVMVSTEDQEIMSVAENLGASIPFKRSEKLSDDFTSTFDVLNDVLNRYNKKGKNYDYACCLYPTAPFITSKILEEAFDLMIKNSYDSVFPIIEYGHPIQRAIKLNNKKIEYVSSENINKRTQDLEKRFHDAGQFYWFSVEKLMMSKKLITNNSSGLIMSKNSMQDIDKIEDWSLAELKFKNINNNYGYKIL